MKHTHHLEGVKVLLVEDEAFIAMAISDHLEGAGVTEIDHALTLSDAQTAVDENRYDVAILDLRLPDGNSSTLANQLIEKDTGIVFHSGHAEIERLGSEFPTARACKKPCRFSDFVDVIRDMMGR